MQNIQEWKLWIPRALLPHKSPPPGYSFGAMFDSFEPQSKCSVFLGEWRGHDTNSSLPTTLCNSCKSPLQMAIFHHLPDAKWALQSIFAAWSCSLWPFKLPEQSFWIQKPRSSNPLLYNGCQSIFLGYSRNHKWKVKMWNDMKWSAWNSECQLATRLGPQI